MEKEQRHEKLQDMILVCMILVPLVPFLLTVLIGYYYFTSGLEKKPFQPLVALLTITGT
jgi:hypothetical protein